MESVSNLSLCQLAVTKSVRWGNDPQGLRLSTPRLRSRISAKWGLEDNKTWYCPEKKKLWVNILYVCFNVYFNVCFPVCVSLTLQMLQPISSIKCESFIFYKEVLWLFFLHVVLPSSRYIIQVLPCITYNLIKSKFIQFKYISILNLITYKR